MKMVLGARCWGLGRRMLVFLAAGLLLSCSSKTSLSPETFFPEGSKAPGWVKTSETRTFAADKLWEYIDGDADRYVRAGVKQTLTSDYRYQEKIEATADIYIMATAEGARKIFESESSQGSQPLAVGDAGRISKGTLVFRQDPYLVRIVAYQDAPGVNEALTALARAIAKRLGGSASRK
jgi:hypothetical protein